MSEREANAKAAAIYNVAADYFDPSHQRLLETIERLGSREGETVRDVYPGSGESALPAA